MNGSILIAAALVCCVSGFVLNSMYAKKYGEAAVQWKLFALQVICIGGALTQFPGDKLSSNRIPTEKNNRLTQHENMLRHNGQSVL